MLTRDPFDIAPAAGRPTPAAWVALALGVLFTVASAVTLERSLAARGRAQESARAQEDAKRAEAQRTATARAQANDPVAREKLRAQQQLQGMLRMSWTGLFDSIEQAARKVDGRVTVTSLAPIKTQNEAAEMSLAGLALNTDALLEYIEALQEQKRVRSVTLTSQQLAQSSGATVTRFHLLLVWEP
jgi:hypothetical protein